LQWKIPEENDMKYFNICYLQMSEISEILSESSSDFESGSSSDSEKQISGPLPSPSDNFVMYISAPRRSGKSTLLVNLLTRPEFYRNKFDKIYIFSQTIYLDGTWGKVLSLLPKEQIFEEFNPELIMQIIDRNRDGQKILIVVDDCIGDVGFKKLDSSDVLTKISTRGRHFGVSLIVSSQAVSAVSSHFRKNTDCIVVFATENARERTIIHEEFLAHLSKEEFRQIFNFATKDKHSFLLFNKMSGNIYRNFNLLNY
jgi:hypothetical protein